MDQQKKITDLESLRAEKERLRILASKQQAVIKDDIQYLKDEYNPLELLNKAATKVVPAPVRQSDVLNVPINFIARKLFHKEENVVNSTDRGKGNKVRNIAMGVAEGVGAWLLTKYIRSKL